MFAMDKILTAVIISATAFIFLFRMYDMRLKLFISFTADHEQRDHNHQSRVTTHQTQWWQQRRSHQSR